MKSTFLVRTEMLGIEPIGKAVRDHAVLRVILGEENSALLAIPVINSDGSAIDWYVEGLVKTNRLLELPEADQATIRDRIARLATDVAELATGLENRGGSENRDTADMLREILNLPDESFIFVFEGRPVLTAWSCARVDGGSYRAGLVVLGPAVAIAAEPIIANLLDTHALPPPAPASRQYPRRGLPWWLWLLWLLFALLVIAIMALLLRACALAPYVGWLGIGNCASDERHADDLGALQLIVADLEDQLRRTAINCPPPAPPVVQTVEPPAVVAEPVNEELEDRIEDLQRGDLEIALIWNTEDDLDLRVEFDCPETGQRASIGFRDRGRVVCGGMLDADANVVDTITDPAEHIVWVDGAAVPPGPMDVVVQYYRDNGSADRHLPYQVTIKRQGQPDETIEGTLAPREGRVITTLQN